MTFLYRYRIIAVFIFVFNNCLSYLFIRSLNKKYIFYVSLLNNIIIPIDTYLNFFKYLFIFIVKISEWFQKYPKRSPLVMFGNSSLSSSKATTLLIRPWLCYISITEKFVCFDLLFDITAGRGESLTWKLLYSATITHRRRTLRFVWCRCAHN